MGSFPCGLVLGSLRRLMRPPFSLLTASALGPSTVSMQSVAPTASPTLSLTLFLSLSLFRFMESLSLCFYVLFKDRQRDGICLAILLLRLLLLGGLLRLYKCSNVSALGR